jgi:hypothetical protein
MDDNRCTDVLLSLSSAKSQVESVNDSLVNNTTSNAPCQGLKNAVLNLIFVEMQSEISSRGANQQDTYGLLNKTLKSGNYNIQGLIETYTIATM